MPIIFEDESRTPSTICYESFESQANFHQTIHGENLATEICSLYGIPPRGQEYNEGALQFNKNGHPPSDDIGSVDITGFSYEGGKWVWNMGPSTNQDCIDRTNVSVLCIECDAGWNADQSEFCLGSGTECAMDLDCCQSPGDPMFCHPVWGTCYHTVQFRFTARLPPIYFLCVGQDSDGTVYDDSSHDDSHDSTNDDSHESYVSSRDDSHDLANDDSHESHDDVSITNDKNPNKQPFYGSIGFVVIIVVIHICMLLAVGLVASGRCNLRLLICCKKKKTVQCPFAHTFLHLEYSTLTETCLKMTCF